MTRDEQSEASAFELGAVAAQEFLVALEVITDITRALLDAQDEGIRVPQEMLLHFRAKCDESDQLQAQMRAILERETARRADDTLKH